jgi:hypothetical protein
MILSSERYKELQAILLQLIQTEVRPVTIEDSLEWDIPLDTLQSMFAQLLKRYTQKELGPLLYGNDIMKRVMVKYIENIEICERETAPSSSSSPENRMQQIYTVLNSVLQASSQMPPSLSYGGGRGYRAKSYSGMEQHDVNKIYQDLQRLIALSPYNLANLYLKMKFPTDSKMSIAKFLSQAESIMPESIPRRNLFYLIGHDLLNAPDIDLMKDLVGKEYEVMLEKLLKKRYMEFETEEDSRRKGRQKTPDILFTIPMAVRLPPMYHSASQRERRNQSQYYHDDSFNHANIHELSDRRRTNRSESFDLYYHLGNNFPSEENLSHASSNQTQGESESSSNNLILSTPAKVMDSMNPLDESQSCHGSYLIVNWIDSKALFADLNTFEENIAQFRTYTNRFGRGMVIYWQGFCEDILNHAVLSMNDDILVCDRFPDDWLFPTGEPADGRRPKFDDIVLPIPPDKVV